MHDELYNQWAQLGVGFVATNPVMIGLDPEKLIVETASAGRDDPRLLFGMYHWLLKHHDLINSYRLIRFIKKTKKTAVMGALLDEAHRVLSTNHFMNWAKYCKKQSRKEFVFPLVEKSKILMELNCRENLPQWKRWGLICRDWDDMSDVIMEKEYVLDKNPGMRFRAIFGPGLRAEVFTFFTQHIVGNIHGISQTLMMDYKSVYNELIFFKSVGVVREIRTGKARVFQMDFKRLHGLIPSGPPVSLAN